MPSSKRPSHRQRKSIEILNKERVDHLLSMIAKALTTSVLHQLEYHRENLSKPAFRVLLLLLITELNSETWTELLNNRYKAVRRRTTSKRQKQWPNLSNNHINHCCQIIFYYIVSVIKKYQIPATENLWNEILKNSLTKNKQFYEYLYKNQIVLPNETCKLFSKKIESFYSFQSDSDKMTLIKSGFIFDRMVTAQSKIKHLEKFFFYLKQREQSQEEIIKPENLISLMNTPEKLSLFLSYFPDYDINQVNGITRMNVLEQLMNMKPYFYLSPVNTNYQIISRSNGFNWQTLAPFQTAQIDSHPNDIVKYRAARIINLLQQLISRGARLLKPLYPGSLNIPRAEHQFFTTSIGIYVIISLYMNDLYSSDSSSQHVIHFVLFIIKYIKRFDPKFQDLILHHLSLTYSVVHKPKFIIQKRENEDEQEQRINDKLFQKSLKLKEWCRLKLRNHCSQKDIQKFNLSKPLVNYCSFGFFQSNYALQCIEEVIRHKGNVYPKNILYANDSSQAIIIESSDDHDDDVDDNEEIMNDDGLNDYESVN